MSYSLFGRKKGDGLVFVGLFVHDASGSLLKVGDAVPWGDALWSLTLSEDQGTLTKDSKPGSISVNGTWYVDKTPILIPASGAEDAMEHTLIVPAVQGYVHCC
ncbi:MAG: hypothetical protein R3F31_07675 [Verrucomicrobiales bacterium]